MDTFLYGCIYLSAAFAVALLLMIICYVAAKGIGRITPEFMTTVTSARKGTVGIAGNIVNQLYNVADSLVVGNFVRSDALAAVGVSFSVLMSFNALFFGLSMGAGILIAQCFGAKRQKQLQDAVNTAFTLTLILGAAITVLGVLLSRGILTLMQTPENIM